MIKIKIIEELPELTLESFLQGDYFFVPKETSEYNDEASSYKNRAERRKENLLELAKVAKGMEEMYVHPPTVPQLIELYAKHKEEFGPFALRKMNTITSTTEWWKGISNNPNKVVYMITHGASSLNNANSIEECLFKFNYSNMRMRAIDIDPHEMTIEKMIDLMPETPEEGAVYYLYIENPGEVNYKPYIDLARIGYKSTLKAVRKLSKEGVEMTVMRPIITYNNGTTLLTQTIFEKGEIKYSFFPEEPVSLLLPKKQK